MEVTHRSSGFPEEAGPGQPGTLSVPSVVPEETLEGSVGPTLMTQFPGDESQSDFTIPALTVYVGGSEGRPAFMPSRSRQQVPS
ncbi:hypothetical protein E2C01_056325 [Portunus trituberculatus]|uniref:Uncharacterized protein n=1 Tax=Portunus trituberculatus TaxID=210409 RepID=A0A5B7GTT4_PORTR|nr:hypothetical protein [Portunus trituberculatus]